jgi:1-acyl-sn-glycerol-3-phosphate acyltransferase
MKVLLVLCMKAEVRGLENFPRHGPALVVTNHLGDADTPLVVGALPAELDALAKIELLQFPIIGRIFDWYGVIWLHRGRPDRRALRCALQALAGGRILIIAPEGRYSRIQGLEDGSDGAAFLARKTEVMIVPVALTGTTNDHVYGHLRRLRRAPVTITVGTPFRLSELPEGAGPEPALKGSHATRADTRRIMERIAGLLPPEYRGVYARSPKI